MALIKLNNNSISAVTALPAGVGGSLVKLSTTTIDTGVASVNFDSSLITSDYNIYKIIYANLQRTSNTNQTLIRFSPDNGTTIRSTGYHMTRWRIYTADDGANFTENQDFYNNGAFRDSPATNDKSFYEHTFFNLLDSNVKSTCNSIGGFGDANNYHTNTIATGRYDTAEAHNYISLVSGSGNFSSGVVTLYGVNQ